MKRVKRTFAQGLFGQFVSHIRFIPMDPKERKRVIEAQRKGLGVEEPNDKGPKK